MDSLSSSSWLSWFHFFYLLNSPTCLSFFLSSFLFIPLYSCLSPLQFGADSVSQTLSKTITTPPRRPLISSFNSHHLPHPLPPSLLPPSLYPSIYPSIDCHYSWTPVIPLLVQLGFPFPSHHSAVCVCVCVCVSV